MRSEMKRLRSLTERYKRFRAAKIAGNPLKSAENSKSVTDTG
jgi:hypothetical protein